MRNDHDNYKILFEMFADQKFKQTPLWCPYAEYKPDPLLSNRKPAFKLDVVGQEGFEPPTVPK